MFKQYNQHQVALIPTSIKDVLGEKHEAILLDEVIENLDLSELYSSYKNNSNKGGSSAFHPKMLLKVIFYGYMTQTFSSRKIAKKLISDLGFMYLTGGNKPDFRTINNFRGEKLEKISGIFGQILSLLKKLGLVTFAKVSLDGTKIYASASKQKNETVEGFEKVIKELLEKAQKIDDEENEIYGDKQDNIPEEFADPAYRKMKIKELIEEAKKKSDDVQNEIDEKKKQNIKQERINTTDKDSRYMQMKHKDFSNGYNAQIMTENQYILESYVSNNAADNHELIPTLERAKGRGNKPEKICTDKGYPSTDNYDYLEKEGIDGYIPPHTTLQVRLEEFEYNPKLDSYKKDGLTYVFKQFIGIMGQKKGRPKKGFVPKDGEYKGKAYMAVTETGKKKYLDVSKKWHKYYKEQTEKMQSIEGKEMLSKRKGDVEPVFGNIKHNMGFQRFSLRGFKKVQIEWDIVSIVHNLKKMFINLAC